MKIVSLAAAAVALVSVLAHADKAPERKPASFTDAKFYNDNLGCHDAKDFKPADFGNGYWWGLGQGTNSGGHGDRKIKLVPLNADVAAMLQSTSTHANDSLCLGGSAIGGPYDGKVPETDYVFSARWFSDLQKTPAN